MDRRRIAEPYQGYYKAEGIGINFLNTLGENGEKTEQSNVLFPVVQNGKWGYINKTGKIVIKPKFEWAWHFIDGLAQVKFGDKVGYINKAGKYV